MFSSRVRLMLNSLYVATISTSARRCVGSCAGPDRRRERLALAVTPMHSIKDKRARLRVAAQYTKTGVVKFPRHGCE